MRKPKDISIGDYTLEEILERHLHWLNRGCKNWESMRANLIGANMIDADMRGANMRGADMIGADKPRKGIKLSEPIIGWKKCKNNVLVKLEIPRGAIVFFY